MYEYKNECDKRQKRPTYKGLAYRLKISSQTVGNVNKGKYNGTPYGDKEAVVRCVANKDFEIIQNLYN